MIETADSGTPPTGAPVKAFEREATGLVRELSTWDVALFNFAILGFLFELYFVVSLVPLLGGNIWLAFLFTAAMSSLLLYTYYAFHVAMPRSGGDYVFVSRSLLPSLGFIGNASYILTLLIYNGITGVTIQTTGLSVGFLLIGVLTHSTGLVTLSTDVSTTTGTLVLGTLEIVLLAIPTMLGKRFYFRIQNVVYVLVFIAVLTMIGLLVTASHATFVTDFNNFSASQGYGPNYYQTVFTTARTLGWVNPSQTSGFDTVLIFPVLSLYGFNFIASTYLGGEIRRPARNSLYGMFGAMFAAMGLTALFFFALYRTVGEPFVSATDFLIYNQIPLTAFPVLPYANFLSLMLTNNSIIIGFVAMMGVLQMCIYIPGFYYMGARSMLAWSFDGILPRSLSNVSPRFHTPINAIIVLVILSEFSLILLNVPYTAAKIYLFSTVLTWYACLTPLMLVGIAAVIFPFRLKKIHDASPANYRIFGIPVISLTGVGTIVFSVLVIYLELTNSVYGANTALAIEAVVAFILIFAAIYFVAKYWRKAQGRPLDMAFKEIPPE
ncbi:MAG: APC family permease [Thermoplasmata archaeon]